MVGASLMQSNVFLAVLKTQYQDVAKADSIIQIAGTSDPGAQKSHHQKMREPPAPMQRHVFLATLKTQYQVAAQVASSIQIICILRPAP